MSTIHLLFKYTKKKRKKKEENNKEGGTEQSEITVLAFEPCTTGTPSKTHKQLQTKTKD